MRLVVARCSVDYTGRLSAHLPLAARLLVCKADGSVLVHSDAGGYKPLMWMTPPCTLREEPGRWTVVNKSQEQLAITIESIDSDTAHDLGVDPGLQKDGVEAHLQQLLADRCEVLGPGWTLVRREYPTDIGPVDLLCRDADGLHVAVEIKRRGEIDGVEQLTRYVERLGRDPLLRPIRGVFAAQEIKPQARVLATERGITCVVLDHDELRGLEPGTPRLW
jgi:RecB family endonuclease NucS